MMRREFSLGNRLIDVFKNPKTTRPSENIIRQDDKIFRICRMNLVDPANPVIMSNDYSSPAHQKILERLVHLVKRISTKQH